jgi:hypothetical protein
MRITLVALRPEPSTPNADNASGKSRLLTPLRYSHGTSFSMLCARRRYGGRIALLKRNMRSPRSSVRLSFTRGWCTPIGPSGLWIVRAGSRPFRTTSRRPVAGSRACAWRATYSSTSRSIASCSIRLAPSRNTSSSTEPAAVAIRNVRVTVSIVAYPSPRVGNGVL